MKYLVAKAKAASRGRMRGSLLWWLPAVALVLLNRGDWGQDFHVRLGSIHYTDSDGTVSMPISAALGQPAEGPGTTYIWCPALRQEIISIIGDVPLFVDCVYLGNHHDWPEEELLCVGDCNGDGLLSIIGDVPRFVDCAYFGNCPE